MKVFLCLLTVIFATMNAYAQKSNSNGITWSVDYGVTGMDIVTSVNNILDELGYTDIKRWTTTTSHLSSHFGVNMHYDDWTIGTSYQSKHINNLDVTLYSTPLIDRIHSSISWWSVHGERLLYKNTRGSHLFVGAGVSHATIDRYVKISGAEAHVKVEETDPFLRVGVSVPIKKVLLRTDYTRRFTDNEDATNIFRATLRYQF